MNQLLKNYKILAQHIQDSPNKTINEFQFFCEALLQAERERCVELINEFLNDDLFEEELEKSQKADGNYLSAEWYGGWNCYEYGMEKAIEKLKKLILNPELG